MAARNAALGSGSVGRLIQVVAMASTRSTVVSAVASGKIAALASLMDRIDSRDDDFSLKDVMDGLSGAERGRVCRGLANAVAAATGAAEGGPASRDPDAAASIEDFAGSVADLSEDHAPSEARAATTRRLRALQCAAEFVSALTEDAESPTPTALRDAITGMHNVLFYMMVGEASTSQTAIMRACERWWTQARPGREGLVVQLLPTLLMRSLDEGAAPGDIKHVYAVRSAFELLDFEDDSIDSLKELLLRCVIHPLYVSRADGRRFLAFLFSLHPSFVDDIHETVKNQMPSTRRVHASYGEVYFKAWRASEGALRLKIERACIQDFMHRGVHASMPAMFTAVRQVLATFIAEKRQRGVDEAIMRLYEPILWRSLAAANPTVRKNAATALVDAFPLQDPEASRTDVDACLQRQFDALGTLLSDPVPAVRVVAVHGVCKILGVFWELIPAATSHALLARLVGELAHDVRSSAVRAGVFEGLDYVLDCGLSHPMLKPLLPALAPLLHDRSERVRAAFVTLLQRISKVRTIRFFDVVHIDHVMARLAMDSDTPAVASPMTELLLPSYFPQGVSGSEQLKRAVKCLTRHPAAALVFFKYAHLHTEVAAVAKLVLMLNKAVRMAIKNGAAEKEASKARGGSKRSRRAAAAIEDDAVGDGAPARKLTSSNLPLMASMLSAAAILWESIATKMAGDMDAHGGVVAQLQAAFSGDSLSSLLAEFIPNLATVGEQAPDAETAGHMMAIASAVLRLAGLMPGKEVSGLQASLWDRLSSITGEVGADGETPPLLAPLLDCLCHWGQANRVWTSIVASLREAFLGLKAPAKAKAVPIAPSVAVWAVEHLVKYDPSHAATNLLLARSSRDTAPDYPTVMSALWAGTTALQGSLAESVNAFVGEEGAVAEDADACDESTESAMALSVRGACKLAVFCAGWVAGGAAAPGETVPASERTQFRTPVELRDYMDWVVSGPFVSFTKLLRKNSAEGEEAADASPLLLRRVRLAYEACAVLAAAAGDCVANGGAEPWLLDSVRAWASAGSDSGSVEGASVLCAIPPTEEQVERASSVGAGASAGGRGKKKKGKARRRGRGEADSERAPWATREEAADPSTFVASSALLQHVCRLACQLASKAGKTASSVGASVVTHVLVQSPTFLVQPFALGDTQKEEILSAHANRMRPFITSLVGLHTRHDTLAKLVSRIVLSLETMVPSETVVSPPLPSDEDVTAFPPVVGVTFQRLMASEDCARALERMLLKQIRAAATSGMGPSPSLALLSAALAAAPDGAGESLFRETKAVLQHVLANAPVSSADAPESDENLWDGQVSRLLGWLDHSADGSAPRAPLAAR